MRSIVGTFANATASTPSVQFLVQSVPVGSVQRKPSSPVATRCFLSTDLMCPEMSVTQLCSVATLHSGSFGNAPPEPPQRGSLASSQPMIVGSSLYLLSLIHISEPTRLGMISYAVFC